MGRRVSITDRELFILAARVGRRLLKDGYTVTTAESCTGGWIAKAITDVAGSSRWFGEGFVTYSDEAKVRQLGVPRSALRTSGAVSEAVARAMARGAIKRAGASHAVAVTGIAGPDGGVPGKPVGTVWFCWARACGPRVHARSRAQALSRQSRGRAPQRPCDGRSRVCCARTRLGRREIVFRGVSLSAGPRADRIRRCGTPLDANARRVACENYHLTIAFAGEVSKEQADRVARDWRCGASPAVRSSFRRLRILAEIRSDRGRGPRVSTGSAAASPRTACRFR